MVGVVIKKVCYDTTLTRTKSRTGVFLNRKLEKQLPDSTASVRSSSATEPVVMAESFLWSGLCLRRTTEDCCGSLYALMCESSSLE